MNPKIKEKRKINISQSPDKMGYFSPLSIIPETSHCWCSFKSQDKRLQETYEKLLEVSNYIPLTVAVLL